MENRKKLIKMIGIFSYIVIEWRYFKSLSYILVLGINACMISSEIWDYSENDSV